MLLLDDLLDDTDGNGLFHVTNGESAEGRVRGEGLNAHGLLGDHADEGGITGLDELGLLFDDLTSSSVDLGLDVVEFASDVRGVAIEDWGVSVLDLAGVVKNDNLSEEVLSILGRVVLGVGGDETSSEILDGEILNVETNVVTGLSLSEGLVMHFDGLALSGDVHGGEGEDHAGLEGTSLDSADGDSSETTDLVDVLEGESQGLVLGSLGLIEGVEGLNKSGTVVPFHEVGLLEHVVTSPAGDGDELDLIGVVADLLEVVGELLLDFVVSVLRVVDGLLVHLVHADDHLLNTHGEGEESVLSGLALLGDTSFELTGGCGDHEDGDISLRGTGDHVLDEVSVAWGINDGVNTLGGLELPESDIDGDTSFSLSLELVHNPGILEGTLARLGGLLLELLNGSLIDTTALVDEMAGSG